MTTIPKYVHVPNLNLKSKVYFELSDNMIFSRWEDYTLKTVDYGNKLWIVWLIERLYECYGMGKVEILFVDDHQSFLDAHKAKCEEQRVISSALQRLIENHLDGVGRQLDYYKYNNLKSKYQDIKRAFGPIMTTGINPSNLLIPLIMDIHDCEKDYIVYLVGEILKECLAFSPFVEICYVCRKPKRIYKTHNIISREDGPAIEFIYQKGYYVYNGTYIPSNIGIVNNEKQKDS